MCVKKSRKVTNRKRVAKGQDIFNIVRGPFCLERSVYREPMGDQVRTGLMILSFQLINQKSITI